eukprot:1525030-Pyramimonas_sp.AAC.1
MRPPRAPEASMQNIPAWIARHPQFQEYVEDHIAATSLSTEPQLRVSEIKEIFHIAAGDVRRFVE